MINKIIKYKKILFDLILNTFSFAIYIVAQQLVLMPVMGKMLNEDSFANLIIFVSIFSIISNSLGSELGIVRQIREEREEYGIYNKTLFYLLLIVLLCSFISIYFLRYSIIDTIMLSFIVMLANIRLYSSSIFRMNKEFKNVLFQNVLYLIGIVLGLFVFTRIKYIWIPSIFAEIISLVFCVIKSDIKKLFKFKKDKISKELLLSFKDYSIIEFLINMITYFDKILIYPILGTNSVNIYYATSTMSKVVSLVTNPLHGVILSWIKANDNDSKKKLIMVCIKFCFPTIIVVSVFCIPITYLAVKVLYFQYLKDSLNLIIPISIGVGFSFASSIIKAIVLKFISSKKLLLSYIIYLIAFILSSLILSYNFGLLGFAYANLFSGIVLLILFFIILKRIIKMGEKNNEN